jgi:hypothetical protein
MTEYRLWIVWIESRKGDDGKHRMVQIGQTFFVPEKDGALIFPPDAARLMHRRHPKAMSVKTVEWLGEKPDHIFKCGAQTEEEAAEQSDKVNAEGDLAMTLMMASEPEARPSIRELCAPTEGPVRILGPANSGDTEA